tara:strand:+ start:897 stop:1493 length:597 start_codon:yes stop_codon:yes gene_type:complete
MFSEKILNKIEKNLTYNDLTFLGSGDNGEAYKTESGKVIKITSDKNEFLYATRLINNTSESNIDVYNTIEGNDRLYIIMEEINTDSNIEDLFNELYNIYTYFNDIDTILDIDLDEVEDQDIFISNESKKMLEDLIESSLFYEKIGIPSYALDIQPDNIGIKNNGKYILFDQRNMFLNPDMVQNEINKENIKRKKMKIT